MLNAIARYFGWNNAPPVPSPVKVKAIQPGTTRATVPAGPIPTGNSPDTAGPAHDKSKVEGSGEDVKPAMEGILSDTLQRTPPAAASPGLPPVDPRNETGAEGEMDLPRLGDLDGTQENPAAVVEDFDDAAASTLTVTSAPECTPSRKRVKNRAASAEEPPRAKRRPTGKRRTTVDPATN